ncbi:hypothetical protein LFT51_29210 (plasmid) [Mycobacterium intracellulare subsp. chimaera]|uniref:hypothetical protein n=1 Tax=Mycobacterium intracellulare TaxID=1767 RepID=UPI000B35D4A0|nr:hypothetical protein [Mycobacterium intracellulare]ARV85391.1 hypothetical protein BWK49_28580 [Mycobacterium intracellulare subsp. chimaera]ASL24292.1 hypothetical protein MYCOZU1_05932 [Mycobacterium intracellulare subsp. chimaera]QGK52138.1 hypothetical protein GJE02_29640 [Mycobacterium intracellulare subsp. chimaera]UCN07154.1 hypothetical protein LFT51_29210 [Mycobacterium intracellulare subsp. chimaera]
MAGTYRPPSHPVLDRAYASTAGAVAYLDETFDYGEHGTGRFYVFTAVVVERTELQLLREELRDIAGGTFWHTTDELRTEEGRKKASEMLNFLGDGDEICVIAHHSRVGDDQDLEAARRACLRGLASTLSVGAAPLRGSIDLMVLEERNPRNRSNLDRKNIAVMRAEGLVHRSMQAVLTSPKYEHLLWLPDLVSSAYRGTFTRADDSLFSLIQQRVHVIDPMP